MPADVQPAVCDRCEGEYPNDEIEECGICGLLVGSVLPIGNGVHLHELPR